MNPERWQRLKDIFEQAVEMEASRRSQFLEEACRDDTSLRSEVNALLELHTDDSFLEKPASSVFPDLLEPETEQLSNGDRLGPYTIDERIGHGGMGIVYLAHDNRLDRPVAVKMLSGSYLNDPLHKERLKREARAAARLTNPAIATVYSLEESGNRMYIVSEYIKGRTLRSLIKEGPLPVKPLLDIVVQIARAFAVAHEYGIIHRDLKPENIMQTGNGDIKILDFGLARIEHNDPEETHFSLTRTGMFLGTPAYSSPEQLLGTTVDFRTDIFSFGVLLYEMASGIHPFGAGGSIATIARILEGEVKDLHEAAPSLPEKLNEIALRCLQKNPEDRYSSFRTLLADLEVLQKACNGDTVSPNTLATKPLFSSEREERKSLWWWQFHQACAGFGYYGMLYPQWRVKEWLGGIEGSLLFFPLLIAVGIAANLRLHLWFTSSFYVSELSYQRRRVSRWIRSADWLFVCMLAVTAVRIHTMHAIIATLLMAVAIGALVAFTLIEPTTTRAALGEKK